MFFGELSDKQWHHLENVQSELKEEYKLRREMLIKRLDVTIQSFRVRFNYKNALCVETLEIT